MPESTFPWKAPRVCVVDARGLIVREGKIASEPEALIGWLGQLGGKIVLTGLEAGPLSQWLHGGLSAGRPDGRASGDPARPSSVQGDVGEDRPQGCARDCPADAPGLVSAGALQVAAGAGDAGVLMARKLLQKQLHAVEMSVRGSCANFGLKVGQTTFRRFEGRVAHAGRRTPTLQAMADALLAARTVLARELSSLEKRGGRSPATTIGYS